MAFSVLLFKYFYFMIKIFRFPTPCYSCCFPIMIGILSLSGQKKSVHRSFATHALFSVFLFYFSYALA